MKESIPAPKLIDGHAHLNEFADIKGVIERASAKGVSRIVAVGMDIESNRRTLALAQAYPDIVYPAIGYHPWSIQVDDIDTTLAHLNRHLERCIAMGEIGLDYKVKLKKPVQREVFARVLDLAHRHCKPVIVHARYSHRRCHRMVADAGIEKAVFHWFSGPLEVLERILEDGYWVSCTPALAYSPAHQAAISQAPLNRILVETDCPVQYSGKASEPAHLLDTLAHLSRLKNLPLEKVARATTANAREFFGI
jgi:TatD DNase family protein